MYVDEPMLTPAQCEERERLIFHCSYDEERYRTGGIARFKKMPLGTVKKLIEKGYLDPEDSQNSSPTAREMVDFADDGSNKWNFYGYAVSPNRPDCRVTIDSIGTDHRLNAEEAFRFTKFFRFADDLDVEIGQPASCWYD